MCGRPAVNDHHILYGSLRSRSELYGLKVNLCFDCHRWIHDHPNTGDDLKLKKIAQQAFIEEYPGLDFREIFERDYT